MNLLKLKVLPSKLCLQANKNLKIIKFNLRDSQQLLLKY
jgi:hypothetical protein